MSCINFVYDVKVFSYFKQAIKDETFILVINICTFILPLNLQNC